jgi:hypothetical protein
MSDIAIGKELGRLGLAVYDKRLNGKTLKVRKYIRKLENVEEE